MGRSKTQEDRAGRTELAFAAAGSFYDTHAQQYFDLTVNVDLHDVYERFLSKLKSGAHILDAGCGSGRDTKAFIQEGYRVTPIDSSPRLAQLASSFTGVGCRVMRFQDMNFHEEFDGIWACASLLHVSKTEMPAVMNRFLNALKTNGIFYVSLKEGQGERIAEDGRFFSYWSSESFRELLNTLSAFHEVEYWKTEERRSKTQLESWLNFIIEKSSVR